MRRVIAKAFPQGPLIEPRDLGAAIRAARTQSRLTLRDAALALGLAVQTLSDIEVGKPGVGLGNVLKAAQGLGVDLFALPKRNRALAELRLRDLSK